MRASLPALTNMFSPTKNPCVVKVTPMKGMKRFRYDPYRASVLAPSVFSPEKARSPLAFTASAAPAAPYVHHFAPHPLVPVVTASPYPAGYVAPVAPAMYSMSSCEVTPAPSVVPSRTPTPVPTIAITTPPVERVPITSSSTEAAEKDGALVQVKHYAIVKFKHDTYPYEAPFRVAVGDHVIVEGDRGENYGTIKEITTEKPTRPVASKVIRKATTKDRELHTQLRRKEQTATKFCENAVKDFGLNMSIVDTEYQLDQNKLSIYFKTHKGMVDFRRLQRVLFREFRCRVWLVNWNELERDCE
jgi:hypothetical protein